MSKKIHTALVAAAKEIPHLRKGEQNAHGNYAYVPIDGFYEQVAPIVLKHGLTWKVREVSCETFEVQGRSRLETAVRTTYEVDVMHEEGDTISGFFKATITHPLQGAQTAGSSLSYLDKLFLRTTFHIVTGEKDADATDNAVFDLGSADAGRGQGRGKGQAKPKGQGAEPDAFDLGGPTSPIPVADPVQPADAGDTAEAEAFVSLSTAFISSASNEAELTQYWTDNETTFNQLKTADPKGYMSLIAGFKTRKTQLKGADA
jgi:hypothetical protein